MSKRIKLDTANVMEYVAPELNLFTSPPIQTSITNETIIPYNPLTTLDKCSNIQFSIPSFQDKYIDLNSIYLKLQLQLTKEDGSAYSSTDAEKQAFIINNILHSIFKGLSIELNGQNVSNTQYYHYKSYLEDLLNFQKSRADSMMQIQGFYLDSGGHMDAVTSNSGAKARFDKTKNSKTIELYGKIHADVFNMQKMLINDVDLKLNFELEKKEFYLMHVEAADPKAELKISEAQVFVRYLTISPTMLLAHHQLLQTRNISYDFKRTVMKNFLIPSGVNNYNVENMFSGALPTNMMIMLIENDAFYGSKTKNPFDFVHNNISHLQLNINGNNVPNYPLTLNPNSGLVARAYHDLHVGLNLANKDHGLMFNEHGFRNGYSIFSFDLTPTKRQNVINLSDTGVMKAELKFNKAVDKPLVMLVYAEFSSSFEVTPSKNIIVNY